jgi:hypothetical protein
MNSTQTQSNVTTNSISIHSTMWWAWSLPEAETLFSMIGDSAIPITVKLD